MPRYSFPTSFIRSKLQYCFVVLIVQLVVLTFVVYNTQKVSKVNVVSKLPLTSVLKPYRRYNLMEERPIIDRVLNSFYSDSCTLDYMNANKLPQDHPCVIETIRKKYLREPSPANVPLKLDADTMDDRSRGQTKIIRRILKNKRNGFFIECGAADGEYLSNTLDLERNFSWTGLLIEANPLVFEKLLSRNRKAWILPLCLSLDPFPTKVTFQPKREDFGLSHIEGAAETKQEAGINGFDPEMVVIQCFPLYSVLLAAGRTDIDFFSLDIEGHELKVLQTVPWHKVNIKSLTVEWDNIPEGRDALGDFMEEIGYISIGDFEFDSVFIPDYINA